MKRIQIVLLIATLYFFFSCGVIHTNHEPKAKTTQKSTSPGNSGNKKKAHPHGAPPGQKKKAKGQPGKRHG